MMKPRVKAEDKQGKKAEYERAFAEGKRSGRLDKMLGLCLQTALNSAWAGYSEGYRAGREENVAGIL